MFKSKKERYAYVQGIKKGNKGGKPWGKQNKGSNKKKLSTYKTPRSGAYNSFGRIDDGRVDDLHGPVVFWEDFEFDDKR